MDNSFLIRLGMDTQAVSDGISKSNDLLSGFAKQVGVVSIALASAFSASKIAGFTLEVSKLSGEAKGVSAAFDRLPNATKLMVDLQQATGNTVSELDLMKRAVQASNFDISLQALPQLLQFATLRAQQTGQSVDYLVDSIVTGIGRKSKLILDNLGISAVQLNEALGGTSTAAASIGDVADAVGKIATDNLKNMANFSDNASTKLQRLDASWKNMKVSIGDAANETGILGTAVDTLSNSFDLLSSKNLSFWNKLALLSGDAGAAAQIALKDAAEKTMKIADEQAKHEQVVKEVDRAYKEFKGDIDAYAKAIETHVLKTQLLQEFTARLNKDQKNQIVTLATLNQAIKEQQDLFDQTDVNNVKELNQIAAKIAAYQKQIDKLEALKKAQAPDFSKLGFKKLKGGGGDFGDSDIFKDPNNPTAELGLSNGELEGLNKQAQAMLGLKDAYDQTLLPLDEYIKAQEKADKAHQRTSRSAEIMGSAVGNAIGNAIRRNEDFGTAAQQVTATLVQTFLERALAGIIASAADSGAPPPIAIAMAAAGAAAIGAMFANIGGSGGGVSGGSNMSNVSYARPTPSDNSINLTVNGKLTADGRQLAIVMKNENVAVGRFGG